MTSFSVYQVKNSFIFWLQQNKTLKYKCSNHAISGVPGFKWFNFYRALNGPCFESRTKVTRIQMVKNMKHLHHLSGFQNVKFHLILGQSAVGDSKGYHTVTM
jgi:hypothetical protein